MELSCAFLPSLVGDAALEGSLAVVIDALRATTVMACALHAGCVEVLPLRYVEEALRVRAEHRLQQQQQQQQSASEAACGPSSAVPDAHTALLLGGERGGARINGFDLGNSPLEYTPERVGGKALAVTTTNGTVALLRCRGHAARIFTAAFVNLSGVCTAILDWAATQGAQQHHAARATMSTGGSGAGDGGEGAASGGGGGGGGGDGCGDSSSRDQAKPTCRVVIVCAGTDGEVAREDVLCAGAIVHTLQEQMASARGTGGATVAASSLRLNDQAYLARDAWRGLLARATGAAAPEDRGARLHAELERALAEAQGGQNVVGLGLGADIRLAASIDLCAQVVPELQEPRGVLKRQCVRGDVQP